MHYKHVYVQEVAVCWCVQAASLCRRFLKRLHSPILFVCACVYQKIREAIVETDTPLRQVLQYFFFCHTLFFECQTFQHNL